MGPDPFVTSPFKGPTLEGDTYDYHVITTDHPYMQEIGLSAFTTGELASWIFKKDKKNDFSNLKIFGFKEEADSGRLPVYAEKILGLGLKSLVGDSFIFSAWRFDTNNFEPYKNTLQSSSNWKYEQGKERYTFKDLNFQDFFNKKTKIPDFSTPVTNIELEYQNNIDDKISNAIEMNNFDRYLRMSLPKSEWSKTQKARSAFILDVKSSFSKYIEWSGVVPFTLNLGVPTKLNGEESDKCIKEEVVKFKLFLFDESLTKNNSRRVTLNELVLVRPQVDAFGRVGTKSNGEISALSTQPNPKQNKAGSLNIKWNEFEGKWESGTEQVIGMMVTPLEAAVFPSLDELMNQSTLDLMISQKIPVGSAMPLVMPNGNPFQIAPEYNSREGCRDKEDNNKFIVRVYNRLPVVFNSGDIVILNKIDGAWQPSIFEKASGAVDDVIVGVDGKWDFTYLMAHCDSYFCNTDFEGITFKNFEEGIRAYYYGPLSEEPLNGAVNYNDAIKLAQVDNNYFQVTSFDCMGPNIGGLREKGNALACTQYYKNPKGEEFGTYVRGNQSGPFFGCVFPDGYELGDKWENYMKSSHDLLKPTGNEPIMIVQTSPYQYMRQIQPSVKVFENNNQNSLAGAAGGMFVLQDSSVDHLPADIALNASPSGENGSPIKPIFLFQFLSSLYPVDLVYRSALDYAFFNKGNSKGIWMTYGEDEFNSAFDFTPVNPGRLTFRPLKLETYASFEFLEYNPSPNKDEIYPYSVDWWTAPNLGTSSLEGRKHRGIFGCKNWIIMNDKQSPISLVAWDRNKINSELLVENPKYRSRYVNPNHPLAENAKYNDIYGFRGLRYNIDIARNIPSLQSRLPPNKDANSFPATMWGQWYGWTHGPSVSPLKDHVIRYAKNGGFSQLDWIKAKSGDNINQEWIDNVNERPAGAVGVIAARCTVTAKNRINIDTDAFFGVDSYRIGSPVTGYTYYASLLGAGNYNTFNTTNLHARVFHAWPKNLTIYDPRFFAVFHFNPGVGMLDDENEYSKYDWYNAGQLSEEEPPTDAEKNYPNGWYQVERSESEVDFRIPTSSIVNDDGISQSLPIEAIINSDTARAKEHCNLDRKRRGRLLPYKYKKLDIGIAPYSDTFTLQAYLGEGNRKLANEVDFIILSPGKNYSVNDRFFIRGGDGVGTVLKPILANVELGDQTLQNAIVGFQTLSPGYGFSAQNFLPSDLFINCTLQDGSTTAEIKDDDGDPILPSLEIIPSGKPAGSDFKGHISRGRVIELIDVDNKPEEIGLENLTGNIDMPSSKDTLFTPPLIQTSKSIEITKPNTNNAFGLKNKYDIFFHFHNDISHTYSMTGTELLNQPPQGYEQYATIDITPN